MMAMTHGVIGVVTYAALSSVVGWEPTPLGLGCAAVGAWLPDVDTPNSKAGFVLYPLAVWLERRFGHRTITHSVLGTLIFAALISPLLLVHGPQAAFFSALLTGYFSHLLADSATKSGVPLAWPNRAKFVFPGNQTYRITTGSNAELVVLALFLVVGWGAWQASQKGARQMLHAFTRDLNGAVRDTEDAAEGWTVEAEVNGYDVLNQRVINERLPVVGRRGDGTLIVEREGTRWVLSEGGDELHRIAPRRVLIHRVEQHQVKTVVLRVENVTLGYIERALAPLAKKGAQVLVTGAGECWPWPEGEAPRNRPAQGIPAVSFGGASARRVEFDFARPHDIGGNGGGAPVSIREATLTLSLPENANPPRLKFPLRRLQVLAGHMRRHADLHAATGQLVHGGQVLQTTFGQTIQPEPTTEDSAREAEARAATRELRALEVEEAAMRRTSLWAQLRAGFVSRRANLERQAKAEPPGPQVLAAPAPSRAPFEGVIEAVEWEPPTIPTRRGELPEHTARLSLVEVKR